MTGFGAIKKIEFYPPGTNVVQKLADIQESLAILDGKVNQLMSDTEATQEDVDALTTEVTSDNEKIQGAVANLLAEINLLSHRGVDVTGLKAALSQLTDNANADVASANPTPTPATGNNPNGGGTAVAEPSIFPAPGSAPVVGLVPGQFNNPVEPLREEEEAQAHAADVEDSEDDSTNSADDSVVTSDANVDSGVNSNVDESGVASDEEVKATNVKAKASKSKK